MRNRGTRSTPGSTLSLLSISILTLLPAGCSPAGSPSDEVPFVLSGSLIDNAEYASRRARLMDEIPDGVAIIPGATSPVADYRFFQSNDFLYFTGVEAPDAWLVVDGVNRESTLFLTLDEHDARGEGIPAELASTPDAYTGIEQARPVEEMEAFLADLGRRVGVFYLSHRPEELPRMNTNEVYGAFQRTVTENPLDGRLTRELQLVERLEQRYPEVEVRDCFRTIQVLRKVKSPAEVALVREAARIGVEAHLEFMRSTEVGMPERALAALFEFVSKREGAQELAYETIIMAGEHHPWGHYHRHDRTLEDGDFIILDAGPDYAYYNADISTTLPGQRPVHARAARALRAGPRHPAGLPRQLPCRDHLPGGRREGAGVARRERIRRHRGPLPRAHPLGLLQPPHRDGDARRDGVHDRPGRAAGAGLRLRLRHQHARERDPGDPDRGHRGDHRGRIREPLGRAAPHRGGDRDGSCVSPACCRRWGGE